MSSCAASSALLAFMPDPFCETSRGCYAQSLANRSGLPTVPARALHAPCRECISTVRVNRS